MSTTLFFLAPIGMLAVVWSLCFVGCVLHTHGEGLPNAYSDLVATEESLLAYWPLNDAMGSSPPPPFPPPSPGSTGIGTAADLSGKGHIGSYLLPPLYPKTPPQDSAEIVGPPKLNMQSASIVPGDADAITNLNPASADFEGGYVSIPWSTQNPPQLDQFTLDAWIQPHWRQTPNFTSVVFSAISGFTGFRVVINDQNQLAAIIGNGTSIVEFALTSTPIDPSDTTYIAVTCDVNGNLTLFAQGQQQDTPTVPMSVSGTGYVAADPTQQVTYFIGAGDNEDAPRTEADLPGGPEFPFQGQIQSVALYSAVLSITDLQTHLTSGIAG